MKKQHLILTAALLVLTASISACSKPAATPVTTAAPETRVTTEAAAIPSASEEEAPIGMPSPMIEYPDIVELQKAANFWMLDLPAVAALDKPVYHIIDQTGIAQILGTNNDGNEVCIRQAIASGDISGYNGMVYEKKTVADVEVNIGKNESSHAAWWNLDSFAYSVSAEGTDDETFNSYVEILADMSKFNLERGAYTSDVVYGDIVTLNEDLGFHALMLPKVYGMEPTTMYMTGDNGAYITYKKDEATANDFFIDIYTEKGTTISHQILDTEDYKEITVNNMAVHSGVGTGPMEGLRGAYWTDGTLSYQIITLGQNEEDFQTLLEYLTNMGN